MPPSTPVTNTSPITISNSRGGCICLNPQQAAAFITASLEDAVDLLTMGQGGAQSDPLNPHPRAGLHAIALSRVQEALDAFKLTSN